jgi:glyoxylase-like metal-dependent hydrolase (beta-lactamase superfamily II)
MLTQLTPSCHAADQCSPYPRGWRPSYILNTHHHWDHTGGNIGLKELYPGLQVRETRAGVALRLARVAV